jgi:outer membrane usher protein
MAFSTAHAMGLSGLHAVVLNGVKQPGFAYLVLDEAQQPYMAEKDFLALGFAVTVPPVLREGLNFVPLFGQEGMQAEVNAEKWELRLELMPLWFAGSRTRLNALPPGKPLPAEPGAWLNYSLQLARAGPAPLVVGSTQSLSIFGPQGLLQLSTVFTSVGPPAVALPAHLGTGSAPSVRQFSRLGTTFFRDNENTLTTLSVGDAVLSAAAGVPSVRYGGLTWQSNFGLDPGFSTLETPTLFDAARLPSTLEFFLNDRRVGGALAVPAGPFEISGLPTLDGAGQVKVLIRDVLNNERIVSVPYLQTARLYRQGLHSFSYTAGLLRPELDRYNTPFLTSTQRLGLTRRITLDAGATLSADLQSGGVGVTALLLDHTVGDARWATSQSSAGRGHQVAASVQWRVSVASMGVSVSHASSAFRLLGDSGDEPRSDSTRMVSRLRDDVRWFASRALAHGLGSVSASHGRLSTWSGESRRISSLSWFRSFGGFNLSLSGVRSNGGTTLFVGLSMPLSGKGFGSSSLQRNHTTHNTLWRNDYASAPVTGEGFALRASSTAAHSPGSPQPGDRDTLSALAAVDARSAVGEHSLQLERYPEGSAWRARTAGSVGMLAGHAFWGPPIASGFALVSTGDAPSIPVYRWNLPVAVSDARGLALVTRLSPYQNNLLAIKPEEVPMAYRVTQHEVTAVPRSRGGVYVAFAMWRERPAVLVLQLPGGQPVPSGAIARVLASGETAPVGQGGEVYLQDLPELAELEVSFKRQRCRITLSRPPSEDPQPRLGPFLCTWAPRPAAAMPVSPPP